MMRNRPVRPFSLVLKRLSNVRKTSVRHVFTARPYVPLSTAASRASRISVNRSVEVIWAPSNSLT